MNWGLQDGRQLAGAAVWECSHSNGQAARGKSISQLCHEGRTKFQVQLAVDLWDIYWPMAMEKAKHTISQLWAGTEARSGGINTQVI